MTISCIWSLFSHTLFRRPPTVLAHLIPISLRSVYFSQLRSQSFLTRAAAMGGDPKMTIMILKVDLQCERCYKKVKKILCRFPQIRDQIFDEKGDKVMIKVWCCSPEKIRDKLCSKGGGTIKSIEIVEPPKKEPEKPKAKPSEPKPVDQPNPDKPKDKGPEKKVVIVEPPKPKVPEAAPKPPEPAPKAPEPAPKAAEKPPKAPEPVPVQVFAAGFPPMYPPVGHCCMQCYEGRGGGPCWHGFGTPPPPPPGCDYGRPVYYDGYGVMNRDHYNSPCTYFSEENPSACTVM